MKINKIHVILILFLLVACDEIMSNSEPNKDFLPSEDTESEATTSLPLFDENSLTKTYLNSYNGLKWENPMGDWEDINGTPQGKIPWATAHVSRKIKELIKLDVTQLIKKQQGKKNQLIVLSATIPVNVSSKEGDKSPVLKIKMQGDTQVLYPKLDCHISSRAEKNVNSNRLQFNSGSKTAFIQFELPKEEFQSATLELWPLKVYGSSGQVQVFNLDFHYNAPSSKDGIAKGLSTYTKLIGHPDVIFVDTFNDSKIKSGWNVKKRKNLRTEQVTGYLTGDIDPQRRNRAAFDYRYYFAKHLKEEPIEMHFRYSIRFHKDFSNATQGGKIPGLAGIYGKLPNRCGWGGRKPSPNCPGWSARMIWKLPIKTGPFKDMIPLGTYLYHLDQPRKYGTNEKWKTFCKLGRWCELEQYVKLNTIGKNDGILRGYHNGKLVYERNDIRYRDRDDIRIENVWALVYHGGLAFPSAPIRADIDNVVISRSYIGPLSLD